MPGNRRKSEAFEGRGRVKALNALKSPAVASLPSPPATRRRLRSCWQCCHERCGRRLRRRVVQPQVARCRHQEPHPFLKILHDAADVEGHDRKNRSGQSEIAQTGVQAGMSYYINNTMSIGSDPFAPPAQDAEVQHLAYILISCRRIAIAMASVRVAAPSLFRRASMCTRTPLGFSPI